MTLRAIRYENSNLEILDQLLLPAQSKYIQVKGVEDGWKVINKMQVQPQCNFGLYATIAIVGCLSLAVELRNEKFDSKQQMRHEIEGKLNYLVSSRPTAVNMKIAAEDLIDLANQLSKDPNITLEDMKARFLQTVEDMLTKDIADNKAIGEIGAKEILSRVSGDSLCRILTHCNTGSLATAGYGTALGVIRSLQAMKRLEHVYCTETRPYNQGARLTAYELVHDKIPATLIVDSMVAAVMKHRNITAVVVGLIG
nr:unnamed protein product [Callosobruchus chinensis]